MEGDRQLSVIFVDDEVSTLSSLRRFLRMENFHMFFAESGGEALQILSRKKIDVMVTDLRMPGISGLDLLEIVVQRFPHIVCLVLSATTNMDEREKILAGDYASFFISKPLDPNELRETIRSVAEKFANMEDVNRSEKLEGTPGQGNQR